MNNSIPNMTISTIGYNDYVGEIVICRTPGINAKHINERLFADSEICPIIIARDDRFRLYGLGYARVVKAPLGYNVLVTIGDSIIKEITIVGIQIDDNKCMIPRILRLGYRKDINSITDLISSCLSRYGITHKSTVARSYSFQTGSQQVDATEN
jgi:hypothetical protein